MSEHEAKLVRLMRLEIIALVSAVDDLGRYSSEERRHLAGGLDALATALRDETVPVLVDADGPSRP